MPNYFTVAGLAPTHDPLWRTAPVATRAAFLRAAREIVLTEWDRQTSEGLDKDGQRLAPIRESTREHRRSAMGPADPNAPPLIPAHELSRTRSLVDGKVVGTAIRVFWKLDPVTGKRWGTILNYHRRGAGHLPVRDVFGLAPETSDRVRRQLELWWSGYSRGLPTVMPIRPRPGKAPRPPAATLPAYTPKVAPIAAAPSKAANVALGTDIYTMSKGSAAELLAAIKGGRFTGFRSYAGGPPAAPSPGADVAPAGRRPSLAKPPAPSPRVAPSRATLAYADEGWERVAAAALGRPVAAQDALDLSGAAAGRASIAIRGERELSILVRADHYVVDRSLRQGDDGRPILDAVEFEVSEGHRGRGIGADVFGRMVDAARRLGIARIETHAVRGLGKNGYYTWARFGYDAEIPAELKRRLPEALASAGRISDLMDTPEGAEWWKANGKSIDLGFDLADGSRSLEAWGRYLRAKAARERK